jgi:transposase
MPKCKNCAGLSSIKSGKARGKQRYKCKECGYHFVEGDERTNEKVAARKALCIMLYSLGKGSFRMIGKILGIDHTLVYRWVVEAGMNTDVPYVDGEIQEIEFDEMWHFIQSKKTNFGSSKPLIVAHGEPLPGLSVADTTGGSWRS